MPPRHCQREARNSLARQGLCLRTKKRMHTTVDKGKRKRPPAQGGKMPPEARQKRSKNKVRLPRIERGPSRWKREILTIRPKPLIVLFTFWVKGAYRGYVSWIWWISKSSAQASRISIPDTFAAKMPKVSLPL